MIHANGVYWKNGILSLGILLLLSGVSSSAQDDVMPSIDLAMSKLSDEIAQYIAAEPDAMGQIAVGSFQGPSGSGAGARIVQALKGNLGPKCRVVNLGAAYTVSGRFMGQKVDGNFVTVIEAEIHDLLGNSVQKLRRKLITSVEEGLAFFGPSSVVLATATLPKSEKTAAHSEPIDASLAGQQLVNSIVHPKTHLDSRRRTRMNPSPESPYGMEVALKQQNGGYQSLVVTDEAGTATVNIDSKQVYAVRLFNDSSQPIGCRLTIDGINIFALSVDAKTKGSEIIMELEPTRTFLITGWHHSANISHEFRTTNYGDSPAARFGVSEGVGVITATFYSVAVQRSFPNSQTDATGLGDKVNMQYREGRAQFGDPVAAVSARYVRPQHPADLPPG